MSDRLTMNITFPMKELRPKPTIKSDIKREYWEEVLSAYLRNQMGAGKDPTPAVDRDEYEIIIQLDVADGDTFYSKHNCGNKGLRDGILMEVLSRINKGDVIEG